MCIATDAHYQLTDYKLEGATTGTEFVLTSSIICLYPLLSVYCMGLSILVVPLFFHSHYRSLSLFLLPPSLPCFPLAVDYFWSAWLISVGSQAQCQGKWSAYKKNPKQNKQRHQKAFFQTLSKALHGSLVQYLRVWVCVRVCGCVSKAFCLEPNKLLLSSFFEHL